MIHHLSYLLVVVVLPTTHSPPPDVMNIEEGQDDAGAAVETVAVANFELPGDHFDATSCEGDDSTGSVAPANRPWHLKNFKQSKYRVGALAVLLATSAVAGTGIVAWQQNNSKRINMYHQSSVVATAKSSKQPKSLNQRKSKASKETPSEPWSCSSAIGQPGVTSKTIVKSDSTTRAIPDGSLAGLVVDMEITEDEDCFCILDVDVTVAIDHPEAGDIYANLTSPDGVTSGIMYLGCEGPSLVSAYPITLDDASTNTALDLETFYPEVTILSSEGQLTKINGEGSPAGTWIFQVGDGASGDVGTLYFVQITIQALCPAE